MKNKMVEMIVKITMPERDIHGEDIIDLIKEGVQNTFPNFKVEVLEIK